jgi:hypothetical protein
MTSMRLAILFAAATFTFAASTKDFSKTVPLDAHGRFSLDTYKGSIHITAWDQAKAEVTAHIVQEPGFNSMPAEDVDIWLDASSGSVRVKTDYRRHATWMEGNLASVHYTIRVPRGVSLTVEDYKSDSDISGVQGDVDFHTYKGTARLNGLERATTIRTYKGEIRAEFAKFTGRTQVDTYKGSIDLSIPRSAGFDLETHMERRSDFICDFPRTVSSSHRQREIRSSVNGGGAELRVTSYRGMVRVRAS